jgi:hypothetical protein
MNTTENFAGASAENQRPSIWKRLAQRWPTAVGIGFAALVAIGTPVHYIAPIVTASGFVYLGSAALRRRAAAWPMFFVTFVLLAITNTLGLTPVWPSWWMLGIAVLLVAYGLIRGARHPSWGLPLQAGAMVLLVAMAITAVNVNAFWAGLLVCTGLLAHTAWDIYHYRSQRVVVRSMAEFCAVLDTCIALVILAATLG